MGVRHTLGILGLALLCQGCGLTATITRNLVIDPAHFDRFTDGFARKIRDTRLADEAWEQAAGVGGPYSKHYARGFKEAYIDFMSNGGHESYSDVPLLPPRSYWRVFYQSPEGNEAIQDWFAGWRHGVAMAKQSGYRNYVILPTTMPPEETGRKDGAPPRPRPPEAAPKAPEPKPEAPKPEAPKPEEGPKRPALTEPPKPPPSDAPKRPTLDEPPKPPAPTPPPPTPPRPVLPEPTKPGGDGPKPPEEATGTLNLPAPW